jgi:hypothetical protein
MRANRLTRWAVLWVLGVTLVIYATLVEHQKETAAGAAATAAAVDAAKAQAKEREKQLLSRINELESKVQWQNAVASGATGKGATSAPPSAAAPAAPAAAAAPPGAGGTSVALPPPPPPPPPGAVPSCLRRFDPRREAMVFMHIGKAAGTSFREAVLGQKRPDGCHFSNTAGQIAYTNVPAGRREAAAVGPPKTHDWQGPITGTYLSECVTIAGQPACAPYVSLDEAKKACSSFATCGGITELGGEYTVRLGAGGPIQSVTGENSWLRLGETHQSTTHAGVSGRRQTRQLAQAQLQLRLQEIQTLDGIHTAGSGGDAGGNVTLAVLSDRPAEVQARRRLGPMTDALARLTEAAARDTDWSREPAPNGCSIPCFCKDHFDWSPIEPLYQAGVGLAPISVMRDPVERAISHFYFCKTLPWTAGMRIRDQSLSEYLADPESMLETRDVWQDGQAGVSWFAGVHIAGWVVNGPILNKQGEKRWRERQSLNATWLLNRATRNFEKFLWVGILEKMSESLEMLEYQGGYAPGFKVQKKNQHKHNAEASAEEKAKLAALMPMDVWFYDHVKRTHEAKWAAFQAIKQTGQAAPLGKENCPAPAVPMPPLPPSDLMQPNALPAEVVDRFGKNGACMSTRFILKCAPSMYYRWELQDKDNNEQHQAMIPPWDSREPAQLGEQSEQPNDVDVAGHQI